MSAFSSNWFKLQSQLPTSKRKGAQSVPKGKRKSEDAEGEAQQVSKKTKRANVETAQA
jgi:hypothetical protein